MTQPTSTDAVTEEAPRQPWRRWLQLLLALALLVPALWFAGRMLADDPEVRGRLASASLSEVLVLLTALFLVAVLNGVVLKELVGHLGTRLPVRAWLGVTLVASMLNLISPISGAGAMRAIYLKHAYGVSYTSFVGVVAVAFFFSVAATGTLACVALILLGVPGGGPGVIALVTTGALVLVLILALGPLSAAWQHALGSPAAVGAGRLALLRQRLAQALESWRALSQNRALVVRLVLWNTLAACLHGLAFVIAFRIAGFMGDWLVPMASSAFARIGSLVSITPAGLGIYEAFAVVSGQLVGAATAQALLGVLIVRAGSILVSLLGGAVCSPLLLRVREGAT